jgi:PTS system nitrogen regulatory IIA component
MSEDDFDLPAVAEYLHLAAAQVQKLVERGQLPGRRVGGQWRFARAEINQWLEERIGLSGEDELARVERSIRQDSAVQPDELLPIYELLPPEAMAIPLPARTRSSVIVSMVEVAMRTGWLWDAERMTEAVRSREELLPTAMDNGVALLHPRRPLVGALERPFIVLGRTDRGIPFGSRSGTLTDLFFLLCSTTDRGHLHALARLSRMLADSDFLNTLRSVADAREAHNAIAEREEALLG